MAAKANFNAYHNYVTDSLHQWDLNQVLTLRGLNLATAPEVHFSNKNMDRAIVRQATMVDHVVTVNIPNSLLQDPLRIYAHIGIYEGSTFTVVETVEIPVIPRVRPLDYQIEDTDGEVYSFNALENKLENVLSVDDVVDSLTSVDSSKPLSANQGRVLNDKITLNKHSACVIFSGVYKNDAGVDFIASSIVPLINAEDYAEINIGTITIMGTTNTVGTTRFTVGRYGTGFCLYSSDAMAVQTVAGQAVSFEFTLA